VAICSCPRRTNTASWMRFPLDASCLEKDAEVCKNTLLFFRECEGVLSVKLSTIVESFTERIIRSVYNLDILVEKVRKWHCW
jgi:hypothetical protein